MVGYVPPTSSRKKVDHDSWNFEDRESNHLDLSKRDVSIITRNNERRKFDSDSS